MTDQLRSSFQISQLIRIRRRQKGWTQAGLASRAGVAEKHISRIENGVNDAGISTVMNIFAALGLVLTAQDQEQAVEAPSIEDMF